MKHILSKTKAGGFINESYEKLNRIAGYVTVVLILCTFIALVMLIFLVWTLGFRRYTYLNTHNASFASFAK